MFHAPCQLAQGCYDECMDQMPEDIGNQEAAEVHGKMLRELHVILESSRQPLEQIGRWLLGRHSIFGHEHISAWDSKSGCWIVERLSHAPDAVYAIGPELPIKHCSSWTEARLFVLVSGAAAEVPGNHDILPYRLQIQAGATAH
jgi:hypothetical protein